MAKLNIFVSKISLRLGHDKKNDSLKGSFEFEWVSVISVGDGYSDGRFSYVAASASIRT